ncbi:conserved protein of unknown function [Ectopseudomonas oleovorans]|uniref:Uncharacterized protein n=1 Tax=Ectopseudomonas oleovorans TaxID=301 RepID=A0A653B0C1_ECTOL|nr:conserved protein of unknown function [Pseudomonas oleovorans]
MDDLKHPASNAKVEHLNRLSTRAEEFDSLLGEHLDRWEEITKSAGGDFTASAGHATCGNGVLLGKKFSIFSELIASNGEVHALITITTEDRLTGKSVVVDSYRLNSYRIVLGAVSATQITANPDYTSDENEYCVICDVLYSLACGDYRK